jgi:hypothetical protein
MVTPSGTILVPKSDGNNWNEDTLEPGDIGAVSKSGDTLTGFLTLHADPTLLKHSATKEYVDTKVLKFPITTITGSQTVNSSNRVHLCNAVAGDIDLTLPSATVASGNMYDFKKTDSSTNTVTLSGAGSSTIDGSNIKIIESQYDNLTIISDGYDWFIL